MHPALKPYEIHPAANLFPLMSDDELRDLAADIKEHGQIHPVITHENKILDGRNRIIACHKAGVLVEMKEWEPRSEHDTPSQWLRSDFELREKSRFGNKSVRAAIGANLSELIAKELKEKEKLRKSKDSDSPNIGVVKGEAAKLAAKAVGVSHSYVSDAKAIKEKSPETFQKVLAGEVTIPEAKKTIFKKDRTETPFKSTPPKDTSTGDSPELLQLKVWWNRASKKDRQAFLKYIKQ